MILSDRDIKKYIAAGKIKITPKPNFKEQLGACSLDLHLGNDFKTFKRTEFSVVDLKTKFSIDQIMTKINVPAGKPLIIQPGDFIIATTQESIELPSDLAARIDGRSSLGRLGIVIHITAARFDPGWRGNAVIELGNLGILPVALYPGMRICAISFEPLTSPCETPYYKKKGQKYAHQKSPRASRINREFTRRKK